MPSRIGYDKNGDNILKHIFNIIQSKKEKFSSLFLIFLYTKIIINNYKFMNNIKQNLKDWILQAIAFLSVIWVVGVSYAAYIGLTADKSSGDALTSSDWNQLVTNQNDLNTRLSWIGSYYQAQRWASWWTPQTWAWTASSSRSYGSDFTCTGNSSECTVNFDGVVQVNWQWSMIWDGSTPTQRCISSLDKYSWWSWTQDIETTSCGQNACIGIVPWFAVIEVSNGDKLRISTTQDDNSFHNCREDGSLWSGWVQYLRIK